MRRGYRGSKTLLILGSCVLVGFSFSAAADQADGTKPSTEWNPNYSSAGNKAGASSRSVGAMLREGPSGGIWQRSNLLGDPLGVRSWLGRYGITFTAVETAEYIGNTQGGVRQDFDGEGLLTLGLQVDTKRAFGLYGGLFNVSAEQIHGLNMSARNLDSLQTSSGIEADDGFRLWELWYQQMFWYNQFDVKVGNQSLDQEFIVSQYASLFMNTMFGWPMLTSVDLLGGGPAYPMAALGLRARLQPSGTPWGFLVGVFNDNASGINPQVQPPQDPQQLNANGLALRYRDKLLLIAEVQFNKPAIGQVEYAEAAPILPATYKLGFWYDFGAFADQEYGTDGLSLAANPPNAPANALTSNGTPVLIQNNYSLYAVVDQLVWRENAESPRGLGFFFRGMLAPPNQNQIDYSLNAGFTLHAPLHHREYDTCGIGVGYADISPRLRSFDRDNGFFQGATYPVRSSETFVELTYQYQMVPWWTLQPDFQFVFNPAAGVNPNNAAQSIPNELVLGLRTNITL